MKEADINTWISLWKERDVATLEQTLDECQQTENVLHYAQLCLQK